MAESTNEDPRKHPPKKWVSNLLEYSSAVMIFSGVLFTGLGALALIKQGKTTQIFGKSIGGEGLSAGAIELTGGLLTLCSGITGIAHSRYANEARRVTRVEELEAERERLTQEIDKNTRTK